MQRAVSQLTIAPNHALIDGNRCPALACTAEAIVKGDLTVPAISAASIIAKVYRDDEMIALDVEFPQYGFARHKGYPTKDHIAALQRHGVIAQHRRSFGPVRRLLGEQVAT